MPAGERFRRWRDRPLRLRFWRELALVVVFDLVYEWTSDFAGSSRALAAQHADLWIRVERASGLFQEHTIQAWARPSRPLIEASDLFYATAHFILPVVALVWLFRHHPARYLRWRDTLAWTTALALVCFAVFPLMPPRMLPARYGIVDTMQVVGGPGSWDTVLLKDAGNQFAAMPSLHISWALWGVLALLPVVRRRWIRLLLILDPPITTLVILVTGNHYILDIFGGVAALGLGHLLGGLSPLYLRRRLAPGTGPEPEVALLPRRRPPPPGPPERETALRTPAGSP